MIETVIDALSGAFTKVVGLVGSVFGEGFEAVAQLSSGIFGA